MADGNTATLTGVAGELRWSYLPAATLGAWTLTSGATGRTLTAAILTSDAYRITQAPLHFRFGRRTWPVIEVHVTDDGRLTARLGPQEV